MLGAVRYGFANGVRIEGELGYRRVELNELNIKDDGGLGAVLGAGSLKGLKTSGTGHEKALAAMANCGTIRDGHAGDALWRRRIGVARITVDKLKVAGVTIVDAHADVLAPVRCPRPGRSE